MPLRIVRLSLSIALICASVWAAPQLGVRPRAEICLNGMWEVLLEPKGKPCRHLADLPADGWRPRHVPSWEDPRKEHGSLWARTSFHLPEEWRKRRVVLRLDSVRYVAQVFVNGRAAITRHEGDGIPIEMDLGDFGRFGRKNTIAVHVEPNPYIKTPRRMGVEGDAWLVVSDRVFIDSVAIRPKLKGGKRLDLVIRIRNADSTAVEVDVAAEVRHQGRLELGPDAWDGRLEPGVSREVHLTRPWPNAVLWGFGKWGRPHLYHLHVEVTSGEQLRDQYVERFGFREFRAEGTRFLFNGQDYFICGDLNSFSPEYCHHRKYFERHLQATRAAGVSFLRIHSRYGFPHPSLFDVADELGFLLEPQHDLFQEKEWQTGVGRRQWAAQIKQFANHPSIVMWSADNEACSHGGDLTPELWERQNEIANLIRRHDPTRMVEEQGDVRLGIAEALGFYDRLDVWNVHPYGTPLGMEMKKQAKQNCYNGKIPIHVGELFFSFAADPFNWWTRPAEYVRRRREMYRFMMAQGKANADAIRSVAEAGAAGASLCALASHDWHGYTPDGEPLLGPWHRLTAQCDEYFDPTHWRHKKYGRTVNTPCVQIRWPALSGPGTKAPEATATNGNQGNLWINWFDPSTFSFFTTASALVIRRAFEDAGGPVPPIADTWAADLVVKVSPAMARSGEAYVFLDPMGNHGRGRQAVRADAAGRAWFAVHEPGPYRATAWCRGQQSSAEFQVAPRPRPTRKQAGYAHVQWVALDEAEVAGEKARLAQPAEIVVRDQMPKEKIEASWPQPARSTVQYRPGPFSPTQDGFVADWLVLGPFPNPGDRENGYQGMATDYLLPMGGEQKVRPKFGERVQVRFPKSDHWDEKEVTLAWRPWEGTAACDLAALTLPEVGLVSPQPPNVVAYAGCYVVSPKAQPARLAIGSDDGFKVWLNHAKVGEDLHHGGAKADERLFETQLRAGVNTLLVKCDQSYGGWRFFLRFFGENGEPLTNIRIARSPDVNPGFAAVDRIGPARPAMLPFEDRFDEPLDTARWIEIGYQNNGSAACDKGSLVVTVTAERKTLPWRVHGVGTAQTFDFMTGKGLAFEWEAGKARSWYTMPYVVLTTKPTGAQVHVKTNPTWTKQPRFVVQLPAVIDGNRNSGVRVFAQNCRELIHLADSVPGEEISAVLGIKCRLEINTTAYALTYDGEVILSGKHGLKPDEWPSAHFQYVTMYNSGRVGNKYVSSLAHFQASRLDREVLGD